MPETKYLIGAGGMSALAIFAWLFVTPRWWRGQLRDQADTMFIAFVFLNPAARRGMYRSLLVGNIGGSIAVAGATFGIMAPTIGLSESSSLLIFVASVTFGGLAIFVLGVTSVVLFNRPKFLIAPHVRHEEGLVSVWRRSFFSRNHGTDDTDPPARDNEQDAMS